jgi:hypothetical protein
MVKNHHGYGAIIFKGQQYYVNNILSGVVLNWISGVIKKSISKLLVA